LDYTFYYLYVDQAIVCMCICLVCVLQDQTQVDKHFANAIFPVENENVFIYLIPKAYVFRTDEASKVY